MCESLLLCLWAGCQGKPSLSHAEVTRRSRAGISPGLIPEYRALPRAFRPEERCSISHTAAEHKQDMLSPFQSIFQCNQPSGGGEGKYEAGSRWRQPGSFWVQGHHREPVLLAAPSSASEDSQDLCHHLILRLNLHTLPGLGAERLHVSRPEGSTQCWQKCGHLSQQKVKDQGMCPL